MRNKSKFKNVTYDDGCYLERVKDGNDVLISEMLEEDVLIEEVDSNKYNAYYPHYTESSKNVYGVVRDIYYNFDAPTYVTGTFLEVLWRNRDKATEEVVMEFADMDNMFLVHRTTDEWNAGYMMGKSCYSVEDPGDGGGYGIAHYSITFVSKDAVSAVNYITKEEVIITAESEGWYADWDKAHEIANILNEYE